jgi:hypothetical protein
MRTDSSKWTLNKAGMAVAEKKEAEKTRGSVTLSDSPEIWWVDGKY